MIHMIKVQGVHPSCGLCCWMRAWLCELYVAWQAPDPEHHVVEGAEGEVKMVCTN